MPLDLITSDWGHVFKFEHFWESRPFLNIYQTFERAIDFCLVCKVNWIKKKKKHQRVTLTYHRVFKLWWHEDWPSKDKATLDNGRENHIWTISQKCNILYESWYSSHRWPVKISWRLQLNLMLWGSQISSHTP